MIGAWINRRGGKMALAAILITAIIALALIVIQQQNWSEDSTQIAHLHNRFPGARCNNAKVKLSRTDANGILLTANHNQIVVHGSADCMASLRSAAMRRGFAETDGGLALNGRPGETETLAFTGATAAIWSEDK